MAHRQNGTHKTQLEDKQNNTTQHNITHTTKEMRNTDPLTKIYNRQWSSWPRSCGSNVAFTFFLRSFWQIRNSLIVVRKV